jgi:hypothetical protein
MKIKLELSLFIIYYFVVSIYTIYKTFYYLIYRDLDYYVDTSFIVHYTIFFIIIYIILKPCYMITNK